MTNNEILKKIADRKVNASYVANLFASFREDLVKEYFKEASKEEIAKEIAAFNSDTMSGTCKVIIASTTKVDKNGNLLDDENNVMEFASSFAIVRSTNKEGETTKERLVFRFPYVGDTIQRNISIVANWLEFRSTREDSFAYARALKLEKVEKEIKAIKAQIAELALADEIDIEKIAALKAKIKELQK